MPQTIQTMLPKFQMISQCLNILSSRRDERNPNIDSIAANLLPLFLNKSNELRVITLVGLGNPMVYPKGWRKLVEMNHHSEFASVQGWLPTEFAAIVSDQLYKVLTWRHGHGSRIGSLPTEKLSDCASTIQCKEAIKAITFQLRKEKGIGKLIRGEGSNFCQGLSKGVSMRKLTIHEVILGDWCFLAGQS